jgi:hypothetical protein
MRTDEAVEIHTNSGGDQVLWRVWGMIQGPLSDVSLVDDSGINRDTESFVIILLPVSSSFLVVFGPPRSFRRTAQRRM